MKDNKEYLSRIEVEDFELLCGDTANMLKLVCGKIGQNGIRYPEQLENTVVFSSKSAHDLVDAMTHKYWDHTCTAQNVKTGDTVFVIINQDASERLGNYMAIKGVAKDSMYRITQQEKGIWTTT
tara:strand:- start:8256 stop:8627 length:372 start_codon:yes stop_codon:yes gene_type:complete